MTTEIELPGERSHWHYRQVTDWFGPLLMRLMGGWHVSGRENIPTDGPALICPNHISYADPPLIGVAARRRCCYMAKTSLFSIPLVGWFIRKSYSYPVDREEGGRQAIRMAATLLGAGEMLVVFPEGTRSADGQLGPGKPGPAMIASRAGAPIIPAAIWGTDIILPRHSKRLYRCPVHIKFGPALRLPEPAAGQRLRKDDFASFTEELMASIADLQEQIIADVPDKWLRRAERLRANWRTIHAP